MRSFLLTSPGMEPRPQEPGKDCLPSILSVPHSRESLGSGSEIGRRRESPLLSGAPQGFSLSRRAAGDWMRNAEVVFLQRRNRSSWGLGGKGAGVLGSAVGSRLLPSAARGSLRGRRERAWFKCQKLLPFLLNLCRFS